MEHRAVIYGQPPAKSNSLKIITIKGHASMAKSAKTKKYEDQFELQCPYRDQNIDKFFSLDIDVYFKSNQPDLDNALKVVLDCLQSCKAIKNDRYCIEIHARKFVDKKNPRIEFTLTTD